jgi:hypothetical protein
MWHELLENLRQQAALAVDAAARAELRTRIGDLLRQGAELTCRGARAVQARARRGARARVAPSLALRAIADAEEDLRVEATEVLLPFLRAGDRHEDRVAVLELQGGFAQQSRATVRRCS